MNKLKMAALLMVLLTIGVSLYTTLTLASTNTNGESERGYAYMGFALGAVQPTENCICTRSSTSHNQRKSFFLFD